MWQLSLPLALCAASLIAVTLGSQLAKHLNEEILKLASGILFAGVGIFIIVSALLG